jgi:histidinol-phosphatase
VDRLIDPSDVAIAHELATIAAQVALPHVADAVDHSLKSDGSPVSACDLAVERALIEFLRRYRPNDGILSEEFGEVARGDRRWLLDPIDGTSQFVSGGTEWGTHVALEVDAEILLGIITRPLQRKRWWGVVGDGAFVDDDEWPDARSARLAVSTRSDLSGARVGIYTIGSSTVTEALVAAGASVHGEGSPILDFVEGRLDAIVSDNCGFLWDHAPAVALTWAAGGKFTDPQGGTRADQQGGFYTNGMLDGQLWDALK